MNQEQNRDDIVLKDKVSNEKVLNNEDSSQIAEVDIDKEKLEPESKILKTKEPIRLPYSRLFPRMNYYSGNKPSRGYSIEDYQTSKVKIRDSNMLVHKTIIQIRNFNGDSEDKEYSIIDEKLTRCLTNLDGVDCCNSIEVRQLRKEAIGNAHKAIEILEKKLQCNKDIQSLNLDLSR